MTDAAVTVRGVAKRFGEVPALDGIEFDVPRGAVFGCSDRSLSWVFATLGLVTGEPETAQAAGFPVLAPLVFASSAFIPVATMPGWLQVFAKHQPVSVTASAVRALVLGGPTASYVCQCLAWCVGIVIVFAPLAVRLYRRS